MKTKYIFVVGGVLSGVGKGVATASIGRILKNKGLNPLTNMEFYFLTWLHGLFLILSLLISKFSFSSCVSSFRMFLKFILNMFNSGFKLSIIG